MRRPLRAALIAAAVATLVTVLGLGNGTLWDNSETAYGEVAREILLTHDWVVMHLNGAVWFVQPPLYFWLAALCAKVFGVTLFALRLPSALATIAIAAVSAYAVTKQAGTRAGLYAGVVLSTSLMQAIVGRLAIMDALLDLAVCLSILWWFRFMQTGKDRYFLLGAAAAAFGFLAKGPVAPVISLLVMLPYYAWERRERSVPVPSWRGWFFGALVFAAIVVPWFALLMHADGLHAVARLIGHYTVGRYTGTIENQGGPVWYYLPVIVLAFFPWIAFVPSAVAFGIGRLRFADGPPPSGNVAQLVRLSFIWMVLPLIFFSFARTKLPNYIALEMPAFAILVALYFDSALKRPRVRSALISTAAVPAFILLLGIAIVVFSRDNRLTGTLADVAINLVYVGAAIFVGSLAAFFTMLLSRARPAAPHVLGGAMVLAIAFLALLALPQAERFKPVPHLAKVIDRARRPGDAVAIVQVAGGNALTFYTRPPVHVLHDRRSGRALLCGATRTWLVGPGGGRVPQWGRPKIVASWGKDALYLYDSDPPCSS